MAELTLTASEALLPPAAPERAWIRPLRDSYGGAPDLLFAGHSKADADEAAEALSCVDEEDVIRGEAAEYARIDVYGRLLAQLSEARAALAEIASWHETRPNPGDSDYDDGVAVGEWNAAEVARKALGGGK